MRKRRWFPFFLLASAAFATMAGIMSGRAMVASSLAQVNPTESIKTVQLGAGEESGLIYFDKPLPLLIFTIIRFLLGLLATVLLLIMLYAGYLWWSAGGSTEKVKEAKKTIRNALIGIIIIMMSRAFLTFMIERVLYYAPPEDNFDYEQQEEVEKSIRETTQDIREEQGPTYSIPSEF